MSDAGEQEEILPAEVGGGEAPPQEEEDPSLEQDPLDALQHILQNIVADANAGTSNPSLSARVAAMQATLATVAAQPSVSAGTSSTAGTNSAAGAVPPSTSTPAAPSLRLFTRTVDLPDELIGQEAIILPKSRRGVEGSKQGSINRERAITAIEGKYFDLMSHQLTFSSGGASTGRAAGQSMRTQIVVLLHLIKDGKKHAINYDFFDITEIGVLKSDHITPTSPTDCVAWWSTTTSSGNLWDAWEAIDENAVLCHQYTLNKRGSPEEHRSNHWLLRYLENSCTAGMKDKLDTKLTKLPVNQQGAIAFLFYLLNEMFHMTREVKKAILDCLDEWSKKGGTTYSGENWYDMQDDIIGLITRLSVIDALDDDLVLKVYEGLTHTSHPELKQMTDLLFTHAKFGDFSLVKAITPKSDNLHKCKAAFEQAVDFYEAQNQVGLWNIPGKGGGRGLANNVIVEWVNRCWNCGKEDHKLPECTQPKDQAKIAAGKKAWKAAANEARKKKGTGKGTGAGGGKKSDGTKITKTRDYNRTKFGAKATGSGLIMVNGEAFMSCQTCGWSNTHGTKHHQQAVNNPNFTLAATHPLKIAQAQAAQARTAAGLTAPTQGTTMVPPGTVMVPQAPASVAGSVGAASMFSRDFVQGRLTTMERTTTDTNKAELCSMLKDIFLKE